MSITRVTDKQVTYKQGATGSVVQNLGDKIRESVSVKDFGASTSNTGAQNVTAYNAAVAAITASGVKTKLNFPTGTYVFNAGITLDITLMSIECESCTFDFSGISTASNAITITGTVGDIYSSIKDALSGVIVSGPSASVGTSIGLYFDAPTTVGPAHTMFRNVGVTNFYTGVSYNRNSYILTFDHCNIYGNSRGFQSFVGTGNNSGERITFINSSIFNNSAYGVRVEDTNADVYLINTSLDYNVQALYLGAGGIFCIGCHFEFADQIGGSDPRFLFADGGGGNTSFASFTACKFIIGTVAAPVSAPVFDVTSTINLSHANCEFYLNTNRSVVFKMRTGSFYNETGAKAQYAGAGFRVLDSGSGYSIASTGQNQVGIRTTGDVLAFNPNYVIGSVQVITDIFTAGYASGQTATSAVALANGVYTLYTHTQSSANSAATGQYLIHRMGTQTVVATVSTDVWVTVAVNGSFQVTVTNISGFKTLDCILVRNATQNI
jgi:hypothetical protein